MLLVYSKYKCKWNIFNQLKIKCCESYQYFFIITPKSYSFTTSQIFVTPDSSFHSLPLIKAVPVSPGGRVMVPEIFPLSFLKSVLIGPFLWGTLALANSSFPSMGTIFTVENPGPSDLMPQTPDK